MEVLWKRSKGEEKEDEDLRKELKMVEAQLRKLKKNGKGGDGQVVSKQASHANCAWRASSA